MIFQVDLWSIRFEAWSKKWDLYEWQTDFLLDSVYDNNANIEQVFVNTIYYELYNNFSLKRSSMSTVDFLIKFALLTSICFAVHVHVGLWYRFDGLHVG